MPKLTILSFFSAFEPVSRGINLYQQQQHQQQHQQPPQQHTMAARCTPAGRNSLKLWQFLRVLLDDPNNQGCIRWLEREKGV